MRVSVLVIVFMSCFSVVLAQDINKLNDDLKRSQDEIAKLQKQLDENKKQQSDRAARWRLLDAQVSQRYDYVRQLDHNINKIKADMGGLAGVVLNQNRKIDSLNRIKNTLYRNAYKELSVSKLCGVPGVQNRFYKREIERVTVAMSNEVASVDSMKSVLGTKYDDLMRQSASLTDLAKEKSEELTILNSERKELDELNAALKKEEGVLLKSAENERVKMARLQSQIAAMVKKVVRSEASSVLSGSGFGANKGRLPSPLLAFSIDDAYGVHDHPTEKGIKIHNTGVNLRSSLDLTVMSVFEGEVRGVFIVEGMGYSVLVRHGKYFTVYSNLERVDVEKGDIIKLGQSVGRLSDSKRVLHFEIWDGTTNQNPQKWIKLR